MSACRVSIDATRCSGIGMCEGTAPDLFEVGDDGHAHLLDPDIPADRFDELRETAANCPTRSISVELVD